jgi:hypothetical protein
MIQYIGSLLGVTSFMITLAIIYKFGYNYFIKLGGISRIIVEIIFFIPCLINIFVSYLLQQYSSTTNEVLLLLAFEAVLFLLYYITYYIQYTNDKVISVLSHVMFLDRKKIVTAPSVLFENKGDVDKSSDGRRRYSISLWVSVNTEVSNRYSVPILQFAQNTPLITYEFNEEKKQNVFAFQCGTNTVPVKSILYLTPQQWHNIVITYSTDKACIYCDGTIVRTVSLEQNVPEYSSNDTLILGSEKILNGAIADVNYFTYELNSLEILGIYNMNMRR